MIMKYFNCMYCGACCIEFGDGLSVSRDEIEHWEKEGHYDILDYVFIFKCKICPSCRKGFPLDAEYCHNCNEILEEYIIGGDLWFDQETGEELSECPFLIDNYDGTFLCGIHETKPRRCKDFPIFVATECENCDLNFVKFFKGKMFPDLPLEEYLQWTTDDFYDKVLSQVDNCPSCGEPIPKYHTWALENCPAVKEIISRNE